MTIQIRTIRQLSEVTGIPAEQIKPENTIKGDLNCDSLDVLEIALALEEEFSCNIDDDEAMKLVTVQDVIDHMNVVVNGTLQADRQHPSRDDLIGAVAAQMKVSHDKAAKWLESEFAAGAA